MTHTCYTCQLEPGMIVRCHILGLDFSLRVIGWLNDEHNRAICHVILRDQAGNQYEPMVSADFEWEVLPDESFQPFSVGV